MSTNHFGGNIENAIALEEHQGALNAKRSIIVDANGAQITTFGASTADGSTFTQNTTAGGIAMGVYQATPDTLTTGKAAAIGVDINRNSLINMATGLNSTDDIVSNAPFGHTPGRVTADGQIRGSAGRIHTVTISPTTATPTAGLITVYDALTETGTILFSEWFFATDQAHTIILDEACATGIYVGYDATATNISVSVSHRAA